MGTSNHDCGKTGDQQVIFLLVVHACTSWTTRPPSQSMETHQRLQSNRDTLLEEYFANLNDVYDLQDTLIQSVLPSVTDELQLGLEAQEWAKEWLSDTCT